MEEASDTLVAMQPINTASVEKSVDEDGGIVNWDGADDPQNPRNWNHGFKMVNGLLVGLSVLCTNFAKTMFAPAARQLAKEFNFHSSLLTTLTVTMPSLGAAAGPLLFAPISEIFGRVRIYWTTGLLFLAFAAGLALSTDVAMFLVFPFLDGVCYTSFLTCSAGTIADLFSHENRGSTALIFEQEENPAVGFIVHLYTVNGRSASNGDFHFADCPVALHIDCLPSNSMYCVGHAIGLIFERLFR